MRQSDDDGKEGISDGGVRIFLEDKSGVVVHTIDILTLKNLI